MDKRNDVLVIDLGRISHNLLQSDMLFFRDEGTIVRDEIIGLIKASDFSTAELDFSGIKVIDFSCSDEIVVMIQENNLWLGGKKILLANLSPSHKENIESALEKKKLAVWIRETDNYFILGKLPKHLIHYLEFVRKNKSVTARQLANAMEEEIASASMKLGKLFKTGMVLREESRSSEGMEYIYNSIV